MITSILRKRIIFCLAYAATTLLFAAPFRSVGLVLEAQESIDKDGIRSFSLDAFAYGFGRARHKFFLRQVAPCRATTIKTPLSTQLNTRFGETPSATSKYRNELANHNPGLTWKVGQEDYSFLEEPFPSIRRYKPLPRRPRSLHVPAGRARRPRPPSSLLPLEVTSQRPKMQVCLCLGVMAYWVA